MPRNFLKSHRNSRQVARHVACEVQNLEQRAMLAGVVTVAISNSGNVTITGDNSDNDVTIDIDEGGVRITGNNGTQIKTAEGTTDAGEPVELLDLDEGTASIAGKLDLKMKDGNDNVTINIDDSVNLSVGKDLNVDLGKGDDNLRVDVLSTGSKLTVGGKVSVKGGDGSDSVFVGGLSVNIGGKLDIDIGTGGGSVRVQLGEEDFANHEEGHPVNNIGKDLVITSKSKGGIPAVDGQIIGEEVDIYVGAITSTRIGGKLDISTSKSRDHVEVFANDTLNVGKDLKIGTDDGDDEVFVIADGGQIQVGANLVVNLGDGDDGFVGGDKTAIEDGLGGNIEEIHAEEEGEAIFGVGGDLKLDGGKGDDKIGLAGATIHRDLDVKGGDGNDVLGGAFLAVGRDLKVDGGKGNDQIGSTDVEVGRDLKLDAGDGNDDLVSSGFIGRNIDIKLGKGDDDFAVEGFDFDEESKHTVKVDFGAGTDNYAGPELEGEEGFLTVSVKNGPEDDEVDFSAIENSIIGALAGVFENYDGFVED